MVNCHRYTFQVYLKLCAIVNNKWIVCRKSEATLSFSDTKPKKWMEISSSSQVFVYRPTAHIYRNTCGRSTRMRNVHHVHLRFHSKCNAILCWLLFAVSSHRIVGAVVHDKKCIQLTHRTYVCTVHTCTARTIPIEINGLEKKRNRTSTLSRLKHDENSMYCKVKLHIDELQSYTERKNQSTTATTVLKSKSRKKEMKRKVQKEKIAAIRHRKGTIPLFASIIIEF